LACTFDPTTSSHLYPLCHSSNPGTMSALNNIPNEVIELILKNLNAGSILAFSMVCPDQDVPILIHLTSLPHTVFPSLITRHVIVSIGLCVLRRNYNSLWNWPSKVFGSYLAGDLRRIIRITPHPLKYSKIFSTE
jgi:hypothetical protein